MDFAEQRRLADENLVAAFSLVAKQLGDPNGGSARFGAVQAVISGVDNAFFNPVLVLDPTAEPGDVVAAVEWVRGRGVPVSVQVREDLGRELHAAAEGLGLTTDGPATPVMALAPIPWHPSAAPAYGSATVPASAAPMIAGVEIHVGGAELLPDWHTALGAGDRFRRLFGPTFAGDSAVRLVVASLDGNPVSAAAAIGFGRTLGVYAVGTVESARRRGIGRAVTWAAIVAGRSAWGSTLAVLQSSEMGRPLYESMGFVQVGALVEYARRG